MEKKSQEKIKWTVYTDQQSQFVFTSVTDRQLLSLGRCNNFQSTGFTSLMWLHLTAELHNWWILRQLKRWLKDVTQRRGDNRIAKHPTRGIFSKYWLENKPLALNPKKSGTEVLDSINVNRFSVKSDSDYRCCKSPTGLEIDLHHTPVEWGEVRGGGGASEIIFSLISDRLALQDQRGQVRDVLLRFFSLQLYCRRAGAIYHLGWTPKNRRRWSLTSFCVGTQSWRGK